MTKFSSSAKYFGVCSSVRKIFKRGGGRKSENNEEQRKFSPLRISPFSFPKFGEDPKKRSSLKFSLVFDPKWSKSLRPDSVRLCAQTLGPSYKGGGGEMPHFCRQFHANYTILAIQKGEAMATWLS